MINSNSKDAQEQFIKKIAEIDDDIKVVGTYMGIKVPVKIQRKSCGHEVYVRPLEIYSGYKCAYCTNKKVLKGYNDMATTAPWIIDYLADKEDAYKYTSGSRKKINFKCPDCGIISKKDICSVISRGYSCSFCSDGLSYPNKFSRALLKQLPVENVIYEYKPKWSYGKKYDNYFEYNGKQYILEMDGGFHYKDTSISNVEDVRANDKLKDEMALEHGLIMIRINCNESEREHLIEYICDSLLGQLFNLNNVDWNACREFATSRLVKDVCIYYEEHKLKETDAEIAKHFNINERLVKSYRKMGQEIGWCSTSIDDLKVRQLLNRPEKTSNKPFDVYDSKHNFIKHFECAEPCAKYMTEKYNQYFSKVLIRRARSQNTPYHGFYFVESNK